VTLRTAKNRRNSPLLRIARCHPDLVRVFSGLWSRRATVSSWPDKSRWERRARRSVAVCRTSCRPPRVTCSGKLPDFGPLRSIFSGYGQIATSYLGFGQVVVLWHSDKLLSQSLQCRTAGHIDPSKLLIVITAEAQARGVDTESFTIRAGSAKQGVPRVFSLKVDYSFSRHHRWSSA